MEDFTTKFERKLKDKASVASRGQTLEGEKDLGADYPVKHKFYTPQEIAGKILYRQIPVLPEDAQFVKGKTQDEKFAYFEKRIQEDKEKYEGVESRKHYAEIISRAYKMVDSVMEKYGGEKRSPMPAIDKIHLVDFYEFCSQAKKRAFNASGRCFHESGEIFIDMFFLEYLNPDNSEEELTRVLSHEIIHDAVASNYWEFEVEDADKKNYVPRRSGLKLVKFLGIDKTTNMPMLKERGRALDEAVIEELSLEAYRTAGGKKDFSDYSYVAERKVLKVLQDKFKIDFRVFAEATVNRRKLPELIRAMAKADKNIDSSYVSMLMAIMDYESKRQNYKDTYPQTMAFINGEHVNLDSDIYKYLGKKFLDENGIIKDTVKRKYNIMIQEQKPIKIAVNFKK